MVGLCRLCASLRKIDVLITINDSNDILEKIRVCCQIDIQMSDDLPKSICPVCVENLNSYHNFYKNVKEAQETLKTLFSSSSTHAHNENTKDTSQNLKQKAHELRRKCKEEPPQKPLKQRPDNYILGQKNNISKETEGRQVKDLQEGSAGKVISVCGSSSDQDLNELESIAEMFESENNINYWEILEQQRRLSDAGHGADDINTKNPLDVLNEVDIISDEASVQISDSEISLKVEYVDNYEDGEEGTDVDSNKSITHLFDKSSPAPETNINSWKNYTFLCFICDNTCFTFIELKIHMSEEHNVKKISDFQYKCYDCKTILPTYHYFLNHIRLKHHDNLKLKCDVCDLSCVDFQELAYHRNVNCAEAKNYAQIVACDECFKSFHNDYFLENHIRYQHKNKTQYKCSHCQEEFRYQSCLKLHEQLHADTKKFCCSYCGRSYTTKHNLKRHEKTHPCNVCTKSYKNIESLTNHKQKHTDNKRFKCQFCAKRFILRSEKNAHECTHTEEMPYSCDQCNKRFRHRSTLCRHFNFHSKPYSCQYCGKTFGDSSNCNKHVRRMHLHCKTQEEQMNNEQIV